MPHILKVGNFIKKKIFPMYWKLWYNIEKLNIKGAEIIWL